MRIPIMAILLVCPTLGVAQEDKDDPCRWTVKEGLLESLCECRDLENDIERLQCFDNGIIIQVLARRALREKARRMLETDAGREAMFDVLGLPSDYTPNDPLGIRD